MRLLLILNDPGLAQSLPERLLASGFQVSHREAPLAAGVPLPEGDFDCVLLDLSDTDVAHAGPWLRERLRPPARPVLVITRPEQVQTRILLLEWGVDDLLVQPVEADEVVAHVQTVMRRSGLWPKLARSREEELQHGRLRVLPARRQVSCDGTQVSLTDMEYWVLETLLRKKGQVLTRDQIESALYGGNNDVGSNAVEVHVHHLRRKLGAECIKTVRGIGYTLAG
jgi:DNA-binding response OmpR family regulator